MRAVLLALTLLLPLTLLPTAAGGQVAPDPLPAFGDLDSPAVRSGPRVELTPRCPSCPQKTKTPAVPDDDEESILPRALNKDLEESDAVAELSMSMDVDFSLRSPAPEPAGRSRTTTRRRRRRS